MNVVIADGDFTMNNSLHSGRGIRFTLSIVAMIAIAAPAYGQVMNEDIKLLAGDGAAGDFFGRSISIDSGVIAVGAYGDDYNGADSGSAYLFDASTGAQIAKLLPSDGAAGDQFGRTIAIDNGVVAIRDQEY